MLVTDQSLRSLFTGFNASFKQGFDGAETVYKDIAMVVPSSTRENLYGYLGQFPKVREWIGDRIIQNVAAHGYAIANRMFESTISASRNDIEDDQFGIYSPMMQELGRSSAELPDELIFGLLKNGFTTNCYDGQYFFDIDHPVRDPSLPGDGIYSVANTDGGTGSPWFLLDTSRAIRPFIYQERRPFTLISMTRPEDDNVFNRNEYVYGTDGRCNAGYGFWQLAWGSRQQLDKAHYEAARTSLSRMRGDSGRLLGIKGTTLVVPSGLEGVARKLLTSPFDEYGATNPWYQSAKLIVTPWLDA